LDTVSKFGWTGVDLFFVLSGYLISSQLFLKMAENKTIGVGDFYARRFFRIIPAFIFVVALYFCIPSFKEWGDLPSIWRFLTFTQNIGLDLRTERTFSHAWSLCIEEQFYLLLPVILALLIYFKAEKKGVFLLSALFLVGFTARYYSWQRFIVPAIDTDDFGVNWYKYIYYPAHSCCRIYCVP
ncbi:MAG: acyltransferase, partial [Flavipsychrobacter sp.]|nr:acyltransferase [Flavipsychrobacter sp.]